MAYRVFDGDSETHTEFHIIDDDGNLREAAKTRKEADTVWDSFSEFNDMDGWFIVRFEVTETYKRMEAFVPGEGSCDKA